MARKFQSIPGTHDILPHEVGLWQRLEQAAHEIFALYGFREIRTPILENTELFNRSMGENTQVVKKEMYTFKDQGGDLVSMRPEGTASVVRAYLQHSLRAEDVITKLYYLGPMFRYERPQKGRLRQFHQIGAELIGVDSPWADAEVITLLDRLCKNLAIPNYELRLNSLGTLAERQVYLNKLGQFFADKKGQLCTECKERLQKNVLRILDCKVESCKPVIHQAPTILEYLQPASQADFEALQRCLKQSGVEFQVDPLIVRGLDYYEKTAFEFVSEDLGAQSAFVGGGRYNHLTSELGGEAVPAVGFAIGCERLILLLQQGTKTGDGLNGVYFVALNESSYQVCRGLLQELRDHGVYADMDYEVKSLKSQMRRANKLGFRYVVIVGEEELKESIVMVKDLETGEQRELKQEGLGEKLR